MVGLQIVRFIDFSWRTHFLLCYCLLCSLLMVVPLLQLVLFGEIVLAQKIMYEKFGNEFLIHFVSKGFPAAHCPQDLAEEYCQKLQVSEIVLAF